MKLNYHESQRGGGRSQALHNVSFFNNLPEPSLWNSQIGRREFLGKIGKASVGTAIVLNGLKLEVMASGSGNNSIIDYQLEDELFSPTCHTGGIFSIPVLVIAENIITGGVGQTKNADCIITITIKDTLGVTLSSTSWGPDPINLPAGKLAEVAYDTYSTSVSLSNCTATVTIQTLDLFGAWTTLREATFECTSDTD